MTRPDAEAVATPSGKRGAGLPLLLFAVLGPPVAWSAHFGVIYFVIAVSCAAGRAGVLLPIAVATLLAAGISAAAGVGAYRGWREMRGAGGAVQRGGRGSSLLFLTMGMLGAAFFTLLILLEALPPLFLPPCPPGSS